MLLTTPFPKLAAKYICAVGLLICFAQYTWADPTCTPAPTSTPATPTRIPHPVDVNIVAHQDDDILFMNPDILNSVVAGHRQVTVFITSGSLNDMCYAMQREAGAIAGYQKLLGLADAIIAHPNHFHDFTESFDRDSRHPASCADTCLSCDPYSVELSAPGTASVNYQGPLHIGSRNVAVAKIGDGPGGPRVMLIFLRVQVACYLDGNSDPDFACDLVNLGQLFQSGDSQLQIGSDFPDLDGYTTPHYTKQQLINQLVDILKFVQPNKVRAQDPADGHMIDYGLSSTTTTIVAPSIGQTLPQPTITVASTAHFPPTGLVDIDVGGVHNAVYYTGTTSTTLTGCYGGSSVMTAGDVVTFACEQVRDQGCSGCDGGANFYDHSDHVWGARFARQAVVRYDNLPNSQNQPTYFAYKGYNLEWNETSGTRVSTKYFCLKKGILFNYALNDNSFALCDTLPAENGFNCFSYENIGYQKGQQQQSP
jgi:GlcNAc-PI de-N-acetylase